MDFSFFCIFAPDVLATWLHRSPCKDMVVSWNILWVYSCEIIVRNAQHIKELLLAASDCEAGHIFWLTYNKSQFASLSTQKKTFVRSKDIIIFISCKCLVSSD